MCLPPWLGWLTNELLARRDLAVVWLERGTHNEHLQSGVPTAVFIDDRRITVTVMIGVDPHKATHTAVKGFTAG